MAVLQAYPKFQVLDSAGAPIAGAKIYSYLAGTSTPQATYTDQTGGTANANPTICDGAGQASIWLAANLAYKIVITDASDVVLQTIDGINAPDGGYFTTLTVTGAAAFATISATGQITSTAGAGVAPFVISASAAKVTNLDADKLDGGDWAAPGSIGATTPAPGAFTTLAASGLASLNGGSINKGNSLIETAQGAHYYRGHVSEEITLSTSGTTTDSTGNILPANAIIEAVVARVTQTITTATDWKLGDATQAARFLAAQSGAQLTAGATAIGLAHHDPTVATANLGPVQSAAAALRVTCTGTPGAGKMRVTVFYRSFSAPAS